jgi:hypothetical protein
MRWERGRDHKRENQQFYLPFHRADALIQVKSNRLKDGNLLLLAVLRPDRKTEVAHAKVRSRLFKTSFGCSQPRISTNGRDTTRSEISFADDPAECRLTAEWDLLNMPFGARRFMLVFAAKNLSGSRRHCAPSPFK